MLDSAVLIGRLRKRIKKLEQQRDHFRERCEYYSKVIELHQYMERNYKSVQDRRKESERVKGLEQRVKEQALLIEKLSAAIPPEGGEAKAKTVALDVRTQSDGTPEQEQFCAAHCCWSGHHKDCFRAREHGPADGVGEVGRG